MTKPGHTFLILAEDAEGVELQSVHPMVCIFIRIRVRFALMLSRSLIVNEN